jgi:hypothetical protein
VGLGTAGTGAGESLARTDLQRNSRCVSAVATMGEGSRPERIIRAAAINSLFSNMRNIGHAA